jgi:outer membrane protein TolC
MTRTHSLLVALLLAFAVPATAEAQLTLRDAFARAERQAYANRIAAANTAEQAGRALAPYRGILPTLRVEAGAMGTTDPIGAFGTTLRQRAITPADFDPARLNFPASVNNRSAGLVIEQPLFNADAWTGRKAAGRALDATEAAEAWTRSGTRVDVVRAFFGATLAAEMRETLAAATRAANAHAARAQALADTGMVTRSDALLARVRVGEIEARQLEAAAQAQHAIRGLAVLLGDPAFDAQVPVALPSSEAIRALVAADTNDLAPEALRADVRAATAGLDAARADALRAKSLYLPRLNGFARYDWNDPTGYFANERSWTVGVMASWTPFAGASEISEVRGTAGRSDAARARFEAAVAQSALAVRQSRDRLVVTLAQLAIAERGAEQSREAHRIVARKYDGGLATISDLLEAAAVETQAGLTLSNARYQVIVADAERRQALGADPASLAALDSAR